MPPAPSAAPQFAYKYDAASNPTSIAANGATQGPTYTSTNEIGGGTYDLNGSPTSLQGATYAWDAANRLISATVGGAESDFTYDGSSRLVRIVEKQGGSTISDKAYTWAGTIRVLEHDNAASGAPVSKQYFAQGVVDGGQGYYYAMDLLGSVRQLIDAIGAIRDQLDYDPYGRQISALGKVSADVGYGGYLHNSGSGLDFAFYRAYNASSARWVSRDPVGAGPGPNPYAYVDANPITLADPSGLCPGDLKKCQEALLKDTFGDGLVAKEIDTVGLLGGGEPLERLLIDPWTGLDNATGAVTSGSKAFLKDKASEGAQVFSAWVAGNAILKSVQQSSLLGMTPGAQQDLLQLGRRGAALLSESAEEAIVVVGAGLSLSATFEQAAAIGLCYASGHRG